MEEVAGNTAVDGAAPWRLGTKRRQHGEIESRKNATITIEPLRWCRLGLSFIQGISDGASLLVVRVITALWEWRWRDR